MRLDCFIASNTTIVAAKKSKPGPLPAHPLPAEAEGNTDVGGPYEAVIRCDTISPHSEDAMLRGREFGPANLTNTHRFRWSGRLRCACVQLVVGIRSRLSLLFEIGRAWGGER